MNNVLLLPSLQRFSVGKILCLGQNYAAHAKEMGSPGAELPVIFLKPSTAIIQNGADILIPPFSNNVHHEVELTLLIGAEGKNIPESNAFDYIAGYGIGLDMTMRDLQLEAKKKGNPWAVAKGFDTSAPLSDFVEKVSDPHALEMSLSVNGERRQHSSTAAMILTIPQIIAYVSANFTLERGDVIFTGTPEGVAQVHRGDIIDAAIAGVGTLHHRVWQ
ncbi:MAG: fumarylacetoacetate hydrolase family protein [Ignavibacteriales bacterium]|nr:fumarylacetoacetate hydrolase family protein [Ignavibacteriales bacterium]